MAGQFGRRKSLKFKTTAHKQKQNKRRLLTAFAIVVAVVLVASLVTFIKEKSKPDTPGEAESEITLSTDNLKENISILFVGVSTSEKKALFSSVITLNTKTRTFTIVCFDPNLGLDLTKPEKYKEAVETKYETTIDRYCIVTQEEFNTFIPAMGKYDVNISEAINYSDGDFSLNLLPGQQTLTCDVFFKYIRYAAVSGTDRAYKAQAEIIGDYISQKLNEKNSEKGQTIYETLVNNSDCNVKPNDYLKYQSLLNEMSKDSFGVETAYTKFLEKK